jgi:hypothetical protein
VVFDCVSVFWKLEEDWSGVCVVFILVFPAKYIVQYRLVVRIGTWRESLDGPVVHGFGLRVHGYRIRPCSVDDGCELFFVRIDALDVERKAGN